jgi:aminoglycoside phosphotransferase (APT) family kinase protein
MSRADQLARGLVEALRATLGEPTLALAGPLTPLGGGFDTEIYTFRLQPAPAAWTGPLVLRLLRAHHDPGRVLREQATQNAVAELGYPAPRVLLACADPAPLGTPFLVMERLPGRPLTDRPLGMAGVLCQAQLRLHVLDATKLARALGEAATLDGYLVGLERRIARASLTGLRGLLDWLHAQRPPSMPPVICHGDLHPQNILARAGQLTGVLDWPNVLVTEPAFDVASTYLILRFVPVELAPVPSALRWLARLGQPILAARYLAGYRHRRPIDRQRLAYYEVAAAMRALVRAGEWRVGGGPEPSPLDRSPYAARLLARASAISGVAAALPGPVIELGLK